MHILCLGTNHNSTPLSLREQLIFTEFQLQSALARMNHSTVPAEIQEMVIISTCNRVEIYAVSSEDHFNSLELFLEEECQVSIDEFRPYLYHLVDQEAVAHLLEVSAGLDSLVLGEPQILGQVTRSMEAAQKQNAAGPLLSRLFQTAIHAGKRSHAETSISRNPASISSWAASLCERTVHNIHAAHITVLGAGTMAKLAVEALRKRGVKEIVIINRSEPHARQLAGLWNAEVVPFEQLQPQLTKSDILIASTGALHPLVDFEMVALAMQARPDRPLALIDIAVPRNIDPLVAGLSGVRLYNIDDLNQQLEHSVAQRAGEIPKVRAILKEEENEFMDYLRAYDVIPVIAGFRQRAEDIRQAELQKTFRHLPDLSEPERERIEAMTRALVKKLLEQPTNLLKSQASHAPDTEITRVARMMFGLPEIHPSASPLDDK